MREAVMRGRNLVVDEIPAPVPGPGQVRVRTLARGICGSNLHALRFADRMVDASVRGARCAWICRARSVMGHEFCAQVLEHGPGTAGTLRPGTRVCSIPMAFGATGLQTVGYSNDAPGGYGEEMILNEGLLLPVSDHVPTEHAALTEPMAVRRHAVEKARLTAGDEIPLVIGCGPVGLAVIAALNCAESRRSCGGFLAAAARARSRDGRGLGGRSGGRVALHRVA
jgi:threonine dehydrogenase-like Zn-dependent dehydrogenase